MLHPLRGKILRLRASTCSAQDDRLLMTQIDEQHATAPTPHSYAAPPGDARVRWSALLTAPELMTVALLAIALIGASFVPRFFDARYLFDRSSLYMETGIMAVAMTFIIIGGHIDLSCASILALSGA